MTLRIIRLVGREGNEDGWLDDNRPFLFRFYFLYAFFSFGAIRPHLPSFSVK
jgi:hypothetical protein